MSANRFLAILVIGLAASAVPLAAHHSVQGEYDTSRTISLEGTVSHIDWLNPHANLWVEAQGEMWRLELPAPNALRYQNIPRDFVKQGDQVTADIWRAKDGSLVAHLLTLTTPDGRVLNFPRSWGPMSMNASGR